MRNCCNSTETAWVFAIVCHELFLTAYTTSPTKIDAERQARQAPKHQTMTIIDYTNAQLNWMQNHCSHAVRLKPGPNIWLTTARAEGIVRYKKHEFNWQWGRKHLRLVCTCVSTVCACISVCARTCKKKMYVHVFMCIQLVKTMMYGMIFKWTVSIHNILK